MSDGGHTRAGPDSSHNSLGETIVQEFVDQVRNPDHPLGPFQDPHSTMIAGIEERVGFVPVWLLVMMIIAVLLATIAWYPLANY